MYRYTAYTTDRRIVQGMIDASSESMAEEALYQAGYHRILRLKEVPRRWSSEELMPTLFGVRTEDIIDFSRQLATLIESGITLITALQLLGSQTPRPALRKTIAALSGEIQGGAAFSKALSGHPQAFSQTYCQVIRASEQTGNLHAGLRQIAGYMEKRRAAAQRIQRALAYPTLVLVIAIGVIALLITVALPPLVDLFTSLGAELPATTRLLIGSVNFLTDYKLQLLGGLVAVAVLISGYARTAAGKLTIDRLMLRLPYISSITIQRDMYHFCQTTSMMIRAGLRLPQIMGAVIQTVGNRVIRQAFEEVRDKLVQGEGLSQPLAANRLFPGLLVEMVTVGEKTGRLDYTLSTLADIYEDNLDRKMTFLTSMIEPVLTVAIGLVVAFIALSMITPLQSILRAIQ